MKDEIKVLSDIQRSYAIEQIRQLPVEPVHVVSIKPYRKNRTLAQNRLLHMWMNEISEGYALAGGSSHEPLVWKEYFKSLFLGEQSVEIRGVIINRLLSTTELNTKQFTDFLERIDYYAAEELGIQLTHPAIYMEAME